MVCGLSCHVEQRDKKCGTHIDIHIDSNIDIDIHIDSNIDIDIHISIDIDIDIDISCDSTYV